MRYPAGGAMTTLPAPHEAQQLHRLRSLRVERARERCAAARARVEAAAAAVRERRRQIERHRRDSDALQHAIVNALAPQLPRWSGMVAAQRDRLSDLLERAEYALVEEEQQLEEAQEKYQQAQAEQTRALAREDAVRGLLQSSRQAHVAARERRAEVELEDQRPPAIAAR